MAKEGKDENIEDQIINEEKRTTTKTEKVVERIIEAKDHQFSDIELVLVVLVAVIIGMIIAALIRKALDERYGRHEQPPPPFYPFYPPIPHQRVHRGEHRRAREVEPTEAELEEDFSRKAALERTPGSFLKHGVYLDEDGEAVYDPDFSVYETWQVMRDARGRISDAVRIEE